MILFLIFLSALILSTESNAQVKIGAAAGTPHSSSMLEVESNTKGFLPPRLSTVQRDAIASPAEGLLIYNTDVKCTQLFRGVVDGWYTFCNSVPSVQTVSTTSVSGYNALVSGNVLADGNQPVTSRGVCYSTSPAPTVANQTVSAGTGLGLFTAQLGDLLPTTTYYVRAFATNSLGTAYGSELTLTTTAGTTIAITSSGNWLCPLSVSKIQVLVVAGGGGGGCDNGGGGGAGGVVFNSSFTVTPGTTYPVTVGSGGSGSSTPSVRGSNGGNSVFSSITAIGGGGGASLVPAVISGSSGGSGGGGSSQPNVPSSGGAGTSGQGNNGGSGNGTHWGGSGGGGAATAGVNGVNPNGGNGGAGVSYLGYTVGGGGGGGANNAIAGTGGLGGGGNGAPSSNVSPVAGLANTGGGGGGGGGAFAAGPGAGGGSGIVVIRY